MDSELSDFGDRSFIEAGLLYNDETAALPCADASMSRPQNEVCYERCSSPIVCERTSPTTVHLRTRG